MWFKSKLFFFFQDCFDIPVCTRFSKKIWFVKLNLNWCCVFVDLMRCGSIFRISLENDLEEAKSITFLKLEFLKKTYITSSKELQLSRAIDFARSFSSWEFSLDLMGQKFSTKTFLGFMGLSLVGPWTRLVGFNYMNLDYIYLLGSIKLICWLKLSPSN